MRARTVGLSLLLAGSVSLPAAGQEPGQRPYGTPPAYAGALPSLAAVNIRNAKLEVMFAGLREPWAFEFIGDGEVLITEIRGRLLRATPGSQSDPVGIGGLPDIATERQQTGLLDVALHPRFAANRRVYISYAEPDPETGRYYRTQVAHGRLDGDGLIEVRPLLDGHAFGWSPSNFGGALAFDAAGRLLISMGDRSEHVLAQRGDRLEGKILRLTDRGAVPGDNPFVDDPGVDDRILAMGLRNAQGLDRDPGSAAVYIAEHGPLGGDEINRLAAGANYGWPQVSYGLAYSTASIGEGTHAPGLTQPLYYYLPSVAISPLVVYRGKQFPEWDGDLLAGALKGKHVSRLDLDDGIVRSQSAVLNEIESRIRDLRVGPEGGVWILTQDGELLRLSRTEPDPPATRTPDGKRVYELVCAGCHDLGASGAPRLDEPCRWREIAARPIGEIYRNTIDGIGEMPERGLCNTCSDAHLERAVDYMLEAAGRCATRD